MYLHTSYNEAVIGINFYFFELFVEFSTTTTTRSLTACEQLRLSAENTTVDAYRPKCTLNGEYEPLQCHRRMFNKECWCVDQLGNEVTGTRMMQPHVPDCITGIWLYCRKNSLHLTFACTRPHTLLYVLDRIRYTGKYSLHVPFYFRPREFKPWWIVMRPCYLVKKECVLANWAKKTEG